MKKHQDEAAAAPCATWHPTITARVDEIEPAGARCRRICSRSSRRRAASGCSSRAATAGTRADTRTGMAVLESLARADGSTGWTVMIGAETPHLLAMLPRERFDKLYADGPDVVVAGGFAPQGRAELADGGYRVTGRWAFASGARHADWIFGNCLLTADGQPLPAEPGRPPETRSMLFPASRVTVPDTWHVLGLRGTGSHDVVVDDVFCPAEESFDLFTGVPCVPGPGFVAPLVHFVLHLGAVAVGIAQGALDETAALATDGRRTPVRPDPAGRLAGRPGAAGSGRPERAGGPARCCTRSPTTSGRPARATRRRSPRCTRPSPPRCPGWPRTARRRWTPATARPAAGRPGTPRRCSGGSATSTPSPSTQRRRRAGTRRWAARCSASPSPSPTEVVRVARGTGAG